ncbi:PREDICTED: uncharacterized protein LOC107339053 [Paramuricea clavata]|uniref:PREDICTED: uncharacterized protein LOC107339053 n=1 Tax=Paramuricea clavata TaxID=317549 RepID=A0A6S7K355_PARCT|nr:PREDICTED: uncharacterized protein LOC107339053 [Paramuricea clavata]
MAAFFIVTKGKHPFGEKPDRLRNLLDDKPVGLHALKNPILKDLLSWMLSHDPNDRPSAEEALKHPYLHPKKQQFEMLCKMGNQQEIKAGESNSAVVRRLNSDPTDWKTRMSPNVLKYLCTDFKSGKPKPFSYKSSWTDCLRLIRNVNQKWLDRSRPMPQPEAFYEVGNPQEYFLNLFPNLLVEVHRIVRSCDWKERPDLKEYFTKGANEERNPRNAVVIQEREPAAGDPSKYFYVSVNSMYQSESDTDDFQVNSLASANQIRKTYLVTYSQADLRIFPTRQSFGEQVATYFDEGTGKVKVEHWACCQESHENSGVHYHMSLKLDGAKRWKQVKEKMMKNHVVVLHFSNAHDNYHSAYQSVTKQDTEVFLSPNHPNLNVIGSPRTKTCIRAFRESRKRKQNENANAQQEKAKKIRRLSNFEVSEFLVANQIKSETELLALADTQSKEGKKDLANFILCRSNKAIQELIDNTWRLQNARAKLDRKKKSRIDLLRDARSAECVDGCNGEWIKCAREVLKNNNIHPVVFASALKDILTKGRGKFRNVMLVGCACSGKTFLLDPLCLLCVGI